MIPVTSFEERFEWIFKARGTSANRLSEDAGLSRAYIRMLVKTEREGRTKRPGATAIDALARTANVSAHWLSTGLGPREPYSGPAAAEGATPAPPVSDTITTLDATRDLINAAYDPERHLPSDVFPVEAALRVGAPLRRTDQDPVAYVLSIIKNSQPT
jgi:transcriptional regulator with XRE-family HTH domain